MSDSAGGQTRGGESSSYLMSLQAASVVSGYIPCDQLAEQKEAQVCCADGSARVLASTKSRQLSHTSSLGLWKIPINQLWMVHRGPLCIERALT